MGNDIEGRHEGETVFVFGDGPSLELIKPYQDRFAKFAPDKPASIAISRAFRKIGCHYILFVDPGSLEDCWEQYNRAGDVFCPEKFEREPNVPLHMTAIKSWTRFERFRTANRQKLPLSPAWVLGLRWSRAACVPAVNLAYLMGASRIVLLGVDLNDRTHWYDKEEGAGEPFQFADYVLDDLGWAATWLRKHGVDCVNCSPESAVRNWKRMPLEEMVK